VTNIRTLPTHRQCIEDAGEWIAKLDRGLSEEEEQALRLWCAQSAENRHALMNLAASWDKMDCLSRLAELFPRSRRRPARRLLYPALAASLVALIAIAGVIAARWPDLGSAQAPAASGAARVSILFETVVGERSTARLPDQSLLVLNTNTLVNVTYSDHQRLLVLSRGEIGIEVAHDRERPLRVVAGGRVIQAVGTAFNVQIINDREVELIVTDGEVLVSDHAESTNPGPAPASRAVPATPTAVSSGERVLLGARTATVSKISESAADAQLSWRQGNLIFRGETLEDAIAEVSRYTPVRFELADERLKDIRIGGLFKAGDVNGLLASLEENFKIESRWIDADRVSLSMQ
jgi:transmembrane sensor